MTVLAHVTHNEVSFIGVVALMALAFGVGIGISLGRKWFARWRNRNRL